MFCTGTPCDLLPPTLIVPVDALVTKPPVRADDAAVSTALPLPERPVPECTGAETNLFAAMCVKTDAQCARRVALFRGDINRVVPGFRFWGETVLKIAVVRQLWQTVQALADRGDVDPNATDANGVTPLMMCARVRQLIAAFPHTRVNVAARDGLTALHYAARNDEWRRVCELLDAGADPTARSACLQTPAHMAPNRVLADKILQCVPEWRVWQSGLRCAWVRACCALARGSAVVVPNGSLENVLPRVLQDAARMHIAPPSSDPSISHHLEAEYALVTALFL